MARRTAPPARAAIAFAAIALATLTTTGCAAPEPPTGVSADVLRWQADCPGAARVDYGDVVPAYPARDDRGDYCGVELNPRAARPDDAAFDTVSLESYGVGRAAADQAVAQARAFVAQRFLDSSALERDDIGGMDLSAHFDAPATAELTEIGMVPFLSGLPPLVRDGGPRIAEADLRVVAVVGRNVLGHRGVVVEVFGSVDYRIGEAEMQQMALADDDEFETVDDVVAAYPSLGDGQPDRLTIEFATAITYRLDGAGVGVLISGLRTDWTVFRPAHTGEEVAL